MHRARSWLTLALLVGGMLAANVASGQVEGVVRDAQTLLPIEGAVVTLQGTDDRAVTDVNGNFTLNVMGTNLVVVAAAVDYFHANVLTTQFTTPALGVVFDLEPVPVINDPSYTWRNNLQCGFCHANQFDAYEPSPMNLTGLNQWVYDIYNGTGTPGGMNGFVYTLDSVHAATFPEAECASCHQPQRWIANPFSALDDITNPSTDALAGVSCEICHKVAGLDLADRNATGFIPGQVDIRRPVEGPGITTQQIMFGPLGDVSFLIPDQMWGSYKPDIGSTTCAVCHQYNSDPDQDLDFDEPGSFPGQTTYDEWAASSYGDPMSADFQTCSDCHMPADPTIDGCIVVPVPRLPGQLNHHDIRGTSPAFLENAATLLMTVNATPTGVEVDVTVDNDQTGHDLPTGINLRNMILLVEATRVANGQQLTHIGSQVIDPSGGVGDPAQGYYGGLAGKLYGRFLEDAGGQGPIPFTDAVAERFNTRIPANAQDNTSYTFELPAADGDVEVRARLIYRRAWRALVDEKGWTMQGDGMTPLADLAPPHFGHLMEEATETVFVVGSGEQEFQRGDCNVDGTYNIADGIFSLGFLFPQGTPVTLDCADACDCNDDGAIDISDAICILGGLFGMPTVPPSAPHPGCGVDPTPGDALDCNAFSPCP